MARTSFETRVAQVLDVIGTAAPDDEPGPPAAVLESLCTLVDAEAVGYADLDPIHRTARRAREVGPAPCDDADMWGDGPDPFWTHYWDCEPCSYPDRTGDRTSVTLLSDFYSDRQFHATAMYVDYFALTGVEHEMMVCLPSSRNASRRVVFFRGAGPDFNERDRLAVTLLRPHLAELDVRIRRLTAHVPMLTLRQREILDMVAAGRSNAEIARALVVSPHTVRKHLENIYERLGVTNRTAAVAATQRDAMLDPMSDTAVD